MEIKQSIHTTCRQTTKRNCVIEVAGSSEMFSLSISSLKRDNGSIQAASEHYLYTEELDALIECLCVFRERLNQSKIV